MIILDKGNRINLTKEAGSNGLNKARVLLQWGAANASTTEGKGGFMNKLFNSAKRAAEGISNEKYDLDAGAVIMRGKDKEKIYYGNLESRNNEIVHSGDDLTGDDDGEEITVNLDQLGDDVSEVAFYAAIYNGKNKGQLMKHIPDAAISIFNADTNELICKYSLNEKFGNEIGVRFGSIYRGQSGWEFVADGSGVNDHIPHGM